LDDLLSSVGTRVLREEFLYDFECCVRSFSTTSRRLASLAAAPGCARPQAAVLARRQQERQDDERADVEQLGESRTTSWLRGSYGGHVSQGDRYAAG